MTFDSIYYVRDNKKFLNGIYLNIPPGKIVGLFGRNGSGKSTIMKIGSGQKSQTNGNIFINSTLLSKQRFNKISYMSQNSFLPKEMQVRKILKMNKNFDQISFNDSIVESIYSFKVKNLSKSHRRYFELILLLSLNRDFYLLDEPFASLDPILSERVSNLLLNTKKLGKGILITDHYYRYVMNICDIAYILINGRCLKLDINELHNELIKYKYL